MAVSREAYSGISFPTREITKPVPSSKPVSLTPSEISRTMLIVPPELTPENPVRTPVGTWRMEGDRPAFYGIPDERLAEITVPERNNRIKDRVRAVARVIFQMD